ncbi:MAG: S41 family peptidase [Candidatus Aminicenantes bacterium]|nr:S41 family peptidase [Candidatus Aminicenantes bacterium]
MKDTRSQTAILCLLGLLLLISPLFAQDARFSGRWVMNHDKTQMQLPDNTIEISQAEGVIHYRQTVKDSQNVWVTQMALSADGKEGSYTNYQGIRLKCSATFRDGKLNLAYKSRQRRSGKWVILDMEDVHSLSEDGKTLSIDHTEAWEGKKGKYPRALVFDRQAEGAGTGKDRAADRVRPQAKTDQAAPKPAAAGLFSKQQLIEDSRELLSYLENIHPDPYLYSGGKVAFHRRFQDMLQSIPPQGMAKDDFLRLLRPFISAMRDGHTAVLRFRDDQGLRLMPLSFASIEKCLFVDGVPSEKDKPLLGAKLLSVEDVSLAEMLERMPSLLGIENDTHGLMMLNAFLGWAPLTKELLPEWQDPSHLRLRLELADGRTQELGFTLRDKNAPALIRGASKIEIPSMEKTQFAYRFLAPNRKTALLKIDGLSAYREMWESEGRSRDITKQLALVYQHILKREAPTDTAAALAGIPSAVETFRQLFTEMKEAGTEALIIDLSQNRGGNSLMADILTHFLYGTQKLAQIVTEERSVKKYSPYFFEALPGRSIDDINRQNAQVQSYPLTENDYDFAEDRFKELFLAGKIDVATGMGLKYADTPTFLAELQSGAYAGYYTPKKVIVTTRHETYSSGFTMLRYLYKSGATVVGSTSAQSGNGFGNGTEVTLKNTGIRLMISKNAYVVFPEAPNERRQIIPHHELTYEKLKSYGFDPQAVVLYALDLMKTT